MAGNRRVLEILAQSTRRAVPSVECAAHISGENEVSRFNRARRGETDSLNILQISSDWRFHRHALSLDPRAPIS